MAYHYSTFIVEQGQLPPRKEELLCAMMGLLFNTVDYTGILLGNEELVNFCMSTGFQPVFRAFEVDEDINYILEHPKTQGFLSKFGRGAPQFVRNRDQQIVMLGPILLTIGKNIQVEGYSGWITKRMRAFMGTLGLQDNDIIWNDSAYPSVGTMNQLSSFLSASHYVRKEIFHACWAVASGKTRYANVLKDVLSLLKGTSMTHIILIDEYLYSRHRELLSIRLLANNHKGMLGAWKYLSSLKPHEVYYAKILFDKEETACLNRNHFPLHTAAAVGAARLETPSKANYRGSEGQAQSTSTITTIVTTYLNRRLGIAPMGFISEPGAFGTPLELQEYLRSIEEEHANRRELVRFLYGQGKGGNTTVCW